MEATLIIGYGNADRQDDGVAWHILSEVARQLGRPVPDTMENEFTNTDEQPDFLFDLQLTPELAETAAQYQRICFVDAHTGRVPEEIQQVSLKREFQASPFTHHLTPETLLAMTASLYSRQPAAILISVRGYEFGFSRDLSPRTAELAHLAAGQIMAWLQTE